MTNLNNNTGATDIDATTHNARLSAQGYTIRHVETWQDQDLTCIIWDAPVINEADLRY